MNMPIAIAPRPGLAARWRARMTQSVVAAFVRLPAGIAGNSPAAVLADLHHLQANVALLMQEMDSQPIHRDVARRLLARIEQNLVTHLAADTLAGSEARLCWRQVLRTLDGDGTATGNGLLAGNLDEPRYLAFITTSRALVSCLEVIAPFAREENRCERVAREVAHVLADYLTEAVPPGSAGGTHRARERFITAAQASQIDSLFDRAESTPDIDRGARISLERARIRWRLLRNGMTSRTDRASPWMTYRLGFQIVDLLRGT